MIFLTDIFGLELRNSKILADSFGERLKCDVFVPDIFNGNPPLRESDIAPYAPDVPNQDMGLSWFGWFKFAMVWVRAAPRLLVGRPGVVRARAENYIRMIKSKQIYSKIAVIGYCYGGGVALGIAAQKGLVDVVVAAHAGPVDVGEVSRAVTPLMMICSEEDVWLPPPKRDQVEAALKGNTATDTKMEYYPGTVHGFACRPNMSIPQVKEAFEKAFEDSVQWFNQHL